MAPPPEYDKEPKAPDKSATSIPGDDSKALHNTVNDHQNNSDNKTANATANVEIENNKHVEHLDDGQLKALLDEAITYKCPKDREGKSSLFNELLEEVEQDEQALEAAARELSGGRAARRAARGGRRALAHSNSLQDLEQEALAAECALRRVRHASHAPSNVSARATHGGSLPSDVDKSFLLGEESSGRGGYLATVRCVNPPPLNERRVSASDAHEHEPTPRRSKPAYPMTYTARATLEIGSGSVGSGRAVTTTTASNQVRTPPRRPRAPRRPPQWTPLTTGPPARLHADRLYNPYHQPDYYLYKQPKSHSEKKDENLNEQYQSQKHEVGKLPAVIEEESVDVNQRKLLDALTPKTERGGGNEESNVENISSDHTVNVEHPRGPSEKKSKNKEKKNDKNHTSKKATMGIAGNDSLIWMNKVNSWYEGLETYSSKPVKAAKTSIHQKKNFPNVSPSVNESQKDSTHLHNFPMQTAASNTQANDRTSKTLEISPISDANPILPYKANTHMQKKPKKVQGIQELIQESTQTKHNVEQPRGPSEKKSNNKEKNNDQNQTSKKATKGIASNDSLIWMNKVNSWYEGLETYSSKPVKAAETSIPQKKNFTNVSPSVNESQKDSTHLHNFPMQTAASNTQADDKTFKTLEIPPTSDANRILPYKATTHIQKKPKKVQGIKELIQESTQTKHNIQATFSNRQKGNLKLLKDIPYRKCNQNFAEFVEQSVDNSSVNSEHEHDSSLYQSRLEYRKRVGSLIPPKVTCVNPKNVRGMTIGKSFITEEFSNKVETSKEVSDPYLVGVKSDDADVENYVISPKLNEIQSKFVSESSKKDIESTKLNHQPIISEDDKSFEDNNNVSSMKSENTTANISESAVCKNTIDEQSCGLSRCEEVIEETAPISTNYQDFSDNSEEFPNGGKAQDIIQDHIDDLDGTQVSNKEDDALIEMKDLLNTKVTVNEVKDTELLEIKPSGKTQDTDVQDQCEAFDMSPFVTIPTDETESMNKEEHNAITDLTSSKPSTNEEEGIELLEIKPENQNNNLSFLKYLDDQRKLFQILEANSSNNSSDLECIPEQSLGSFHNINVNNSRKEHNTSTRITEDERELQSPKSDNNSLDSNDLKLQVIKKDVYEMSSEKYVFGVIPNNSCVFLTFLKSFAMPSNHISLHEVETDTTPAENTTTKRKKKKRPVPSGSGSSNKRVLSREEFRALLFHNAFKSETQRQRGTSAAPGRQIDSAIPFNCITSPEVVDACSTTSSAQASVAEETKPLQLGWGYRAVASLTGAAAGAPPMAASSLAPRAASEPSREQRQPRSVISSSFNGLPLARSGYGSTGTTTSSDEYKKSIDENGNSLQGFSSPQSGSSHNKKPRRKKSSRNETVITSHQIDGYKGDKDLNEVLRFIESDAEPRHKLGRAKHRDEAAADDKAGKKRSADRRKDKETKMKRATSMEELSRTKLEDLTDTQRQEPQRRPAGAGAAPAKPERRSWGDDARDAFYFRDEAAAAAADAPPDADFQTVTKKRKPRRRADEPEPDPPRSARPRPPTPRARRVSAPPSDRSADSNDDMDSVHSLPADAPRHAAPAPAPAPVSYADIARTRHNIPDLIESCNFYAEGGAREAGEARAARGDADGYPALEPRLHARRPRDHHPKPPAPLARSRDRKEVRSVTCVPEPAAAAAACPAPDVVADRRPPVILLDASARPGDMDGVTFGFDINEQLLGGSTRRPRCDLVREAVESDAAKEAAVTPPEAEPANPAPGDAKPAAPAAPATVALDTGNPVVETPVAVKPVGCGVAAVAAAAAGAAGGCGALRWVPPRPPLDTHHLLQIVDYVAQAWEDVVRCGSGKVRYFAE